MSAPLIELIPEEWPALFSSMRSATRYATAGSAKRRREAERAWLDSGRSSLFLAQEFDQANGHTFGNPLSRALESRLALISGPD